MLGAEIERAWLIWLRTNPHVIVVIKTVHLLLFVVAQRNSRRLRIPLKAINDSGLIPIAGSDLKPIVFGAKRRWRSYSA